MTNGENISEVVEGRLYKQKETREILGISASTLNRRINEGAIPVVHDGGRFIRFKGSDILTYIESLRRPSLDEILSE